MAPVLKTGIPGRVSGVRIPHSPPYSLECREICPDYPENNKKSPQFCGFSLTSRTGESVPFNTVGEALPSFSLEAQLAVRFRRHPLGERYTITKRRCGESDLTSASDFCGSFLQARFWTVRVKRRRIPRYFRIPTKRELTTVNTSCHKQSVRPFGDQAKSVETQLVARQSFRLRNQTRIRKIDGSRCPRGDRNEASLGSGHNLGGPEAVPKTSSCRNSRIGRGIRKGTHRIRSRTHRRRTSRK
jgi:hypothetical protein